MEVKINVDKLSRQQLIQILGIVSGQSEQENKEDLPKKIEKEITVKPITKPQPKREPIDSKVYQKKPKLQRLNKQWTKEEIQTAVDLKEQGKSDAYIGKIIGRNKHSVGSMLWRFETKSLLSPVLKKVLDKKSKRYAKYTKTEIDTLIKERKAGNSFKRISELLGRNIDSIKNLYWRTQNPKMQSHVMKKVLDGDV